MSNTEENNKQFCFIVTGFGPFNGVPDNPTSILVKELPDYLQQSSSDIPDGDMLSACTETMIIETSAEAVRQEIESLCQKLEPYPSAIVLHLGVDASSKRFHLEKCAYNDATFRVPDEKGYQPTREPVVETCDLGTTLLTSFDVPSLVAMMNETVSTNLEGPPLANPSTDPGRFVCNYIYCASMNAFQCAKIENGQEEEMPASECDDAPRPRVQSLFLHVPPFEAIPKEEQLIFVTRLMSALYQQKKSENGKLQD